MNPPCDTMAAPETRALLDYFYSITGLRTLAGQQSLYWDCANAAEVLPVKQDRHVFNTVGKYPAVYGVDLGDGQDTFHLQRTMELIRRQATSGRIITVSYHFPGNRGDLAGVVDVGNTTVRPPFIARVEQMVELFRSLDADGARVPTHFPPSILR
jgi:Glycosyl hydrolase family 26